MIVERLTEEQLRAFHVVLGRNVMAMDEQTAKLADIVRDDIVIETGRQAAEMVAVAAREAGLETEIRPGPVPDEVVLELEGTIRILHGGQTWAIEHESVAVGSDESIEYTYPAAFDEIVDGATVPIRIIKRRAS